MVSTLAPARAFIVDNAAKLLRYCGVSVINVLCGQGLLALCLAVFALGGVVSYVPAAHVRIALHTRSACACGAADVYWPSEQRSLCVVHSRFDVVLAALVSHSSGPHASAASQAAPLLTSENVLPRTQAAHSRSAMSEPLFDSPLPIGHFCQAVHAPRPDLLVKVP